MVGASTMKEYKLVKLYDAPNLHVARDIEMLGLKNYNDYLKKIVENDIKQT